MGSHPEAADVVLNRVGCFHQKTAVLTAAAGERDRLIFI